MKFGYQAVYDRDFFDAIGYAAANRFDYVSFDLNVPRFYVDRMADSDLDRLRRATERAGVGLAFHAPGDNVSLFSDYPAIREGIVKHFGRIIAAAEQWVRGTLWSIRGSTRPSSRRTRKRTTSPASITTISARSSTRTCCTWPV